MRLLNCEIKQLSQKNLLQPLKRVDRRGGNVRDTGVILVKNCQEMHIFSSNHRKADKFDPCNQSKCHSVFLEY